MSNAECSRRNAAGADGNANRAVNGGGTGAFSFLASAALGVVEPLSG
jgi:hypothetical protein